MSFLDIRRSSTPHNGTSCSTGA